MIHVNVEQDITLRKNKPIHFNNVYRIIFAFNIYLFSTKDTVSDGATKTEVLNIEKAQRELTVPRNLYPMC